jgi:hypothetical protein
MTATIFSDIFTEISNRITETRSAPLLSTLLELVNCSLPSIWFTAKHDCRARVRTDVVNLFSLVDDSDSLPRIFEFLLELIPSLSLDPADLLAHISAGKYVSLFTRGGHDHVMRACLEMITTYIHMDSNATVPFLNPVLFALMQVYYVGRKSEPMEWLCWITFCHALLYRSQPCSCVDEMCSGLIIRKMSVLLNGGVEEEEPEEEQPAEDQHEKEPAPPGLAESGLPCVGGDTLPHLCVHVVGLMLELTVEDVSLHLRIVKQLLAAPLVCEACSRLAEAEQGADCFQCHGCRDPIALAECADSILTRVASCEAPCE